MRRRAYRDGKNGRKKAQSIYTAAVEQTSRHVTFDDGTVTMGHETKTGITFDGIFNITDKNGVTC